MVVAVKCLSTASLYGTCLPEIVPLTILVCALYCDLAVSTQAVVLGFYLASSQGVESHQHLALSVDFSVSHQGDYAVFAGQENCISEWAC